MPITTDPDEDLPQSDLNPRVRKYFEDMVAQGGRVESPEYARQLAGSRSADADASIGRAQLGGIAEGLSRVGTLAGKSPDVKPLTTTLTGLDAAQKQRNAGMMADEDDAQKRSGMNAKVYEYLQSRADKTREAAAARHAKSDDLATTLAAKAEEAELKRQADAEKLRQHNELVRATKEGKSTEPTKLVGSDTATHIGNYDAALVELGELEKSYNTRASARGSSVRSIQPGSPAFLHEKQVDLSAQAIGQILEGGKLTDNDYARYKDMMPRATDTNEAAAVKLAALKRAILEKKRGAIGGAGQAGYKVSGFNEVPESPKIAAPAPKTPSGTAVAAPAGAPTKFKDGDTMTHVDASGKSIPVVRKGGVWVEVTDDDDNQPAVEPHYAP